MEKKKLKNRSPGTLKLMVLLGRVAKKTISTLLQKTPEMDSKISLKLLKLIRYSSGRKDEKPTKKNTQTHNEFYQKAYPKGKPRTWLSHPTVNFGKNNNRLGTCNIFFFIQPFKKTRIQSTCCPMFTSTIVFAAFFLDGVTNLVLENAL